MATNRDKLLNKINAYSDVELGIFMHLHNISTNDDNNIEDWSDTDYTHWLSQEAEEDKTKQKETKYIKIDLQVVKDYVSRIYGHLATRVLNLEARVDKLEEEGKTKDLKDFAINDIQSSGYSYGSIENGKTADEMFAELGYEKHEYKGYDVYDSDELYYTKTIKDDNDREIRKKIEILGAIECYGVFTKPDCKGWNYIDKKEDKAIHKKIEELKEEN